MLDSNPANGGTFTFADANALSKLAYLTQLRVRSGRREAILAKRDTGYGQGPGQFIADGQPYRLDVWWQAARPLRDHQERRAGAARAAHRRGRDARSAPRIQRSRRLRRDGAL